MPHYAQLYEQVGESKDIGFLLESHPLAASLFMISLARADAYGILPGDPRDFRTRVCPSAGLPVADVEAALEELTRLNMYLPYEANGKSYIYVLQYHAYQQIRWDRVASPGSPLPREWSVPKSLKDELAKGSPKGTGYYGLQDNLQPLPESSWTPSGLTGSRYKGTRTHPGPLPDSSGTTPAISVSVAVPNVQDPPPPHPLPPTDPAAPAETASPPVAAPAKRTKQRGAELEAEKARLLQDLPDSDLALIRGYLENAADENDTKRITLGREVTIIGELAGLYQDLGPERWRYGVTEANKHRAPNANYVKKVAAKYGQQTRASPAGSTDTERRARRTHSDWENWEPPDENR